MARVVNGVAEGAVEGGDRDKVMRQRSQDTTKATRQRQLSVLRKLAQMAFVLTPDDHTRRMYGTLKIIKALYDNRFL